MGHHCSTCYCNFLYILYNWLLCFQYKKFQFNVFLQGSHRSLKSYIDLSIFKALKSLKNGNFSVEGLKIVLNFI